MSWICALATTNAFLPYLLIECHSHRMDSGRFESFNKVRHLPSVITLRHNPSPPPALRLPQRHGVAFYASKA